MSEYYMMDSWGLKTGEPTQKPLDVDFDDWEDEWGINEDDVVKAIRESGVDNLETFDVRIIDSKTGEVCKDYQAVNILGLVKAADMEKSVAMAHAENGLIDTDFDSVKLDETAVQGCLMFRLAESVNAVVVHRSVKEYLESKGGFELTFTEPGNWVG